MQHSANKYMWLILKCSIAQNYYRCIMLTENLLEWVKLTVLIDNRLSTVSNRNLISTWGLSIVAETSNGNILFDLNGDWKYIEHNANILHVDLNKIDWIIISHMHGDHAGGLKGAIKYYEERMHPVKILLPEKQVYKSSFIEFIYSKSPVEIFSGAITTGVLGHSIKEQSLILNVRGKGPIILVGCSHPGIPKILNRTCRLLKTTSIYALIGGYHINAYQAIQIIPILEKYNVKIIGPAHCTGNLARKLLKQYFKSRFLDVFTGATIEVFGSTELKNNM